MTFTRFGSAKLVNVNIDEYKIDWSPAREVSRPQAAVKQFLLPYWKRRICLEEFRIPSSLLRVDLICLNTPSGRVAVEVSPKGSHSFNKFFHKSRAGFGAAMKREMGKTDWLEKNGFIVVEIFDEDIPALSLEWFREKYGVTL